MCQAGILDQVHCQLDQTRTQHLLDQYHRPCDQMQILPPCDCGHPSHQTLLFREAERIQVEHR